MSWTRAGAITFSAVVSSSHRIVPGRVVRHSHCDRTCKKHNNYTTPAYVYANYVRHRQSIHTQEVENAPESTTHSPDHASAPDTCQLNPQSILSIIVDDAETQEHLFHLVQKKNLHRAMSINASRSRMHYRNHVRLLPVAGTPAPTPSHHACIVANANLSRLDST